MIRVKRPAGWCSMTVVFLAGCSVTPPAPALRTPTWGDALRANAEGSPRRSPPPASPPADPGSSFVVSRNGYDEIAPGTFGPVAFSPSSYARWPEGQVMVQGLFGATLFDRFERKGGSASQIDGSGTSVSDMPTIGGGAQWKLAGNRLDIGVEGLLALSWRSDGNAIVSGGGGAVVAVDVGLLLVDLYGGPFVSMSLGEKFRIYGGAGPMMQWADYDQTGPNAIDSGSGSGFGLGYYTRAGIEADLGGTLVGLGVRWSQSSIDLSGGQGDLELDGLQLAVTVAHWY